LLTFAIDLREIVVGELAPLLFDLSSRLLPISFNSIPVNALAPR